MDSWIPFEHHKPTLGQRVILSWGDEGQRPAAYLANIEGEEMWIDEWSIEPMEFSDPPQYWWPVPNHPHT